MGSFYYIKNNVDIIAAFKEYQFGDIVFLCKAAFAFLVFKDTALQVVGDACVEDGVMGIGHDVDAILFFTHVVLRVSLRYVIAICHCEKGALPDEAISCDEGTASFLAVTLTYEETASGREEHAEQERPRNDIRLA